jgi:hypothetical protein
MSAPEQQAASAKAAPESFLRVIWTSPRAGVLV